MDASVFLKSNRCRTSLTAWFRALSTSCRSTLLTMSNELSEAIVFSSCGSVAGLGATLAPTP